MTFAASSQVVPIPTDIGVIADEFDLSTITTGDLIFAGVAFVTGLLLAQLAKRALRRVLSDIDNMPLLAADVIARIVGYVIVTIGIVLALEALGFSLGLVGSLLLLLIVLVVLAARPLLQDLGAGLIIQLRRPFHVGDQIAIDGIEGNIDEVNARTVRVVTVDGRRVHFPNRTVLESAITNLTAEGRRLTTFLVGVDYGADLERAREIIVSTMRGTTNVLDEPEPEAFVEEFGDSAVIIACRFWHRPQIQQQWTARDEAMRAVKRALDENDITIPLPQRVLWQQPANT